MGYAHTRQSVLRVQSFLDAMLDSDRSIEWVDADPPKTAFYIRQAIKAAKGFDDTLKYTPLVNKYIIRTKGNRVIAQLRNEAPMTHLKETLSVVSLAGVDDTLAIIGATIMHKAPELHFPDAQLDDDQLRHLYEWTSKEGYAIIKGDGVTLTKKDVGEIEWVPL